MSNEVRRDRDDMPLCEGCGINLGQIRRNPRVNHAANCPNKHPVSVETSKPADLLEGSKSESVHKFLWNWAHSRGISTDMDGDCTTERWLEIICERFKSAAHISEVERLQKLVTKAEQVAYERVFDVMTATTRAEAAESKLSQLQLAVRNVYFAGIWSCDRPVDESRLWTELRDAAGFKPGESTAILNGGQS